MTSGKYFFLLLAVAFAGCFFWARSLFRRGKHGRGIAVMMLLPAVAASIVWFLILFVSLCIYGI